MSLHDYHRKRNFGATSEPRGRSHQKNERLKYVIQRHQASHLHYDLRLEYDGVLKSWAVPKGPSLNPSDKRLAMAVEDHPIEYANFHGTIPKGEYGAGEVEIWDQGHWEPQEPSVRSAIKNGSLKFEIFGKRLKGLWALVRMRKANQKNAWLLIKEKDQGSSSRGPKLTKADKILFPESQLTKLDLAKYYSKSASRMLPHISGKPIMILRCPDGRGEQGFFQKNWNKSLPSSIKGKNRLLMVDSVEGLLALAQLGVLEIHTWCTDFDHVNHPTQFVFDIDPSDGVKWNLIVESAYEIRDELLKYGLKSFLKATGGKGMHVVAPVKPELSWNLGKAFCKGLCEDIAARSPEKYLTTMTKSKRTGRIFLDYLRNGRGSTAIAPYSPRARFDAPLAIPLRWSDLERGLRSDTFHLRDLGNRAFFHKTDPWKEYFKLKQLPEARVLGGEL